MFLKALTPKQKQILDYIQSFINEKGYAPSLEEIANRFKKAVPTIHQYIGTLKEKGFLNKEENVSRGIQLKQKRNQVFLLGYIAAGDPIEPLENPETINVPELMINTTGNYYALKVKGDSMVDEGIIDGDIIVIKHQQSAENGDTVVAITENGATLKKFRKINGRMFLEPKNKKYKIIQPKNLEIRGKFIGLIRKSI
jgi:repressor LexA